MKSNFASRVLTATLFAAALLGVAAPAAAGEKQNWGAILSYKPLMPAEPLGTTGFDIGVDVNYTGIKSDDKAIVTRLHAAKGLPYGVDLGGFFGLGIRASDYEDETMFEAKASQISMWGLEARYAILAGDTALPAISVRGAYTSADVEQPKIVKDGVTLQERSDFDASTKSIDVSISKGLLMFTPYAGLGMVFVDVDGKDANMMKYYAGLNFGLGALGIAAEIDQTGGITTYSGKLALRW